MDIQLEVTVPRHDKIVTIQIYAFIMLEYVNLSNRLSYRSINGPNPEEK